jgi:hypothetical protein
MSEPPAPVSQHSGPQPSGLQPSPQQHAPPARSAHRMARPPLDFDGSFPYPAITSRSTEHDQSPPRFNLATYICGGLGVAALIAAVFLPFALGETLWAVTKKSSEMYIDLVVFAAAALTALIALCLRNRYLVLGGGLAALGMAAFRFGQFQPKFSMMRAVAAEASGFVPPTMMGNIDEALSVLGFNYGFWVFVLGGAALVAAPMLRTFCHPAIRMRTVLVDTLIAALVVGAIGGGSYFVASKEVDDLKNELKGLGSEL